MIPGFGDISGGQGGVSPDLSATNGDFMGGSKTAGGINLGAVTFGTPSTTNTAGTSGLNSNTLLIGVAIVAAFMILKKGGKK